MSGTSEHSTFHKIYLHCIFQNLSIRLKMYSPRLPLGTVTFSPEIGWKKENSWASGQPSGYRAWPDLFFCKLAQLPVWGARLLSAPCSALLAPIYREPDQGTWTVWSLSKSLAHLGMGSTAYCWQPNQGLGGGKWGCTATIKPMYSITKCISL